MKNEESPKRPCKTEDGRRAEYRSDYAKARPNRFVDRMKNGVAAVILDPDVAAVFGSSQVVNAFTRSVITTLPVRMRELAKVAWQSVGQGGIGHAMAWGTKKTEHVGAKKGTGAFYGRKADAKRGSNHRRRQDSKATINAELLQSLRNSQQKS